MGRGKKELSFLPGAPSRGNPTQVAGVTVQRNVGFSRHNSYYAVLVVMAV